MQQQDQGEMNETTDDWRPTKIKRFVGGVPSSTHAAIVETDAGRGYLKALGGNEGPHTLASEFIATSLANWFKLSTFDFGIIDVFKANEIYFYNSKKEIIGIASDGPAFITRAEDGEQWSGSGSDLDLVQNRNDISRLIVFDTWVLNCDRHSRNQQGKVRQNLGNVFLSFEDANPGKFTLKAMDHTHCFTCGREWVLGGFGIARTRDENVFGCFDEFKKRIDRVQIVKAAQDLTMISKEIVFDIIQKIPRRWEVSSSISEQLADHIVARAKFVSESIERRLWPQLELFQTSGDEP